MKNYIKYSVTGMVFAALLIMSPFKNNAVASDVLVNEDEVRTTYTQEVVNLDKTSAMEEYIAKSRRKIKNNWYPPTSSFENKATIIVTLDKKGQLINCVIAEPSSNIGFDNSLIKAVEKTKFSPLPDAVVDDTVDIDFTFNMEKRSVNKN